MKPHTLSTALLASLLPAACAPAITLIPSADAFVSANSATNNFGAAGALAVSAPSLSKGELQSLLRFDTSAAKTEFDITYGPGHWTLASAVLTLTTAAPNPSNPVFNSPNAAGSFTIAYLQNDAWTEGTGTPGLPTTTGLTFNSLPSFLSPSDQPLGTFTFPGGTAGSNSYNLSLPTAFLNDLLAADPITLDLAAADSTVTFVANSHEFGTPTARPSLTLIATPEPSSLSAILYPLSLLLLRRRQTRA